MRLDVSLNGAEADALQQILDRHGGVLDKFEKNLLASVTRKVKGERANVPHPCDGSWRRFVWAAEDISVVRSSGSEGRHCACECHPRGSRPFAVQGEAWCTDCLGDRAWLGGSLFMLGDDPIE